MHAWAKESNRIYSDRINNTKQSPQDPITRFARFIIFSSPLLGTQMVLKPKQDQACWTLGSSCQSDFYIRDDSLRAQHLLIEHMDDDWLVTCQDESDVFFVNDEPVETVVIEDGDRIQVGDIEMMFVDEETRLPRKTA